MSPSGVVYTFYVGLGGRSSVHVTAGHNQSLDVNLPSWVSLKPRIVRGYLALAGIFCGAQLLVDDTLVSAARGPTVRAGNEGPALRRDIIR